MACCNVLSDLIFLNKGLSISGTMPDQVVENRNLKVREFLAIGKEVREKRPSLRGIRDALDINWTAINAMRDERGRRLAGEMTREAMQGFTDRLNNWGESANRGYEERKAEFVARGESLSHRIDAWRDRVNEGSDRFFIKWTVNPADALQAESRGLFRNLREGLQLISSIAQENVGQWLIKESEASRRRSQDHYDAAVRIRVASRKRRVDRGARFPSSEAAA